MPFHDTFPGIGSAGLWSTFFPRTRSVRGHENYLVYRTYLRNEQTETASVVSWN